MTSSTIFSQKLENEEKTVTYRKEIRSANLSIQTGTNVNITFSTSCYYFLLNPYKLSGRPVLHLLTKQNWKRVCVCIRQLFRANLQCHQETQNKFTVTLTASNTPPYFPLEYFQGVKQTQRVLHAGVDLNNILYLLIIRSEHKHVVYTAPAFLLPIWQPTGDECLR